MTQHRSEPLAFAALLIGNLALACGPFLVRHSGVGPIAAGFWRLALALPFLWAMIAALALITFFPELVLWLPRLMGYQG